MVKLENIATYGWTANGLTYGCMSEYFDL